MADEYKAPATDPDEVREDDFDKDLKKPTEQDGQQQPPPSPGTSSQQAGQKEPGATKPDNDDDDDTIKPPGLGESDSDFGAWMTVQVADVGVSFACQAISGEFNPELFAANRSNKKKLEEVTSAIFERYKVQISPWLALAGTAAVTFAPPIQTAMKFRKMKADTKNAAKGSAQANASSSAGAARKPGRPTKQQQEIDELERKLREARKKAG